MLACRQVGKHWLKSGMTSQSYTRISLEIAYIWRKLTGQRRRAQTMAKRAFNEALADLTPDDVAIDLGANVGEFTLSMAATGARVYAFEPDPHAFAILEKKLKDHPGVTLIEAAEDTEDGTTKLYRSTVFDREPDRRTKSSSLFSEKHNVSADHSISIDVKDFPTFLTALDHDIALIKIDIEGGEVPLLEALLDAPVATRIGNIFVETHERGLPQLADRTAALRSATAGRKSPNINWDWH